MKVSPEGLWTYILITLKPDNLLLYSDLSDDIKNKLAEIAQRPSPLTFLDKILEDRPTLDLLIERLLILG